MNSSSVALSEIFAPTSALSTKTRTCGPAARPGNRHHLHEETAVVGVAGRDAHAARERRRVGEELVEQRVVGDVAVGVGVGEDAHVRPAAGAGRGDDFGAVAARALNQSGGKRESRP